MATKSVTIRTVTCDLCQEEGAERIPFSLGDGSYFIDLCSDHQKQLLDSMDGWIAVARSRRRKASSEDEDGEPGGRMVDSIAVRAWARENGYDVSEKGRLSNQLLEAYQEAHPEAS